MREEIIGYGYALESCHIFRNQARSTVWIVFCFRDRSLIMRRTALAGVDLASVVRSFLDYICYVIGPCI